VGHGGKKLKHSFLIFALIVLSTSFAASAAPDSVVTGPYKVSFDIGLTRDSYNVTVPDPVIGETLGGEKSTSYIVRMRNRTGDYRSISIAMLQQEKGASTIPTGSAMEMWLKSLIKNDPSVSDFESSTRTIDGMNGAAASMKKDLGTGIISDQFIAIYPAANDPTHVTVFIMSDYPWNEGTLKLLKTIHVEKAT
jgi:hypothetical protein